MKQFFIMVMILLIAAGCSPMRQGLIDVSTENIKNVETLREVAEICRTDWLFQSGLIKALIGSRINELPAESIATIKELDRLAEQTELTDYELGRFLGLKASLSISVLQVVLEKYAPGLLDILPLVF